MSGKDGLIPVTKVSKPWRNTASRATAALVLSFFFSLVPASAFTLPSAPLGFTATAVSTSKVNLSWQAAVPGGLPIANYPIYRGTSPSTLTQLAKTTKLLYTDATVTAGATYYYAVAAADTGGNLSSLSPVVAVKVPLPPSPPTGLAALATSATALNLSWNTAVSGGLPIGYYLVFRGSSPANLALVATISTTTYTNRSLTPGGVYYFAVESQDSGRDDSALSPPIIVTMPTLPLAPTGLAASPISDSKESLTWNASVTGGFPIMLYKIFRGTSPSSLSQIATVTLPAYIDQTVKAGTTYYYAVQAEDNGTDLSPQSAVFTVLVPSPPAAPANVVGAPSSAAMMTLTWSPAVSGGLPVLYYQVYRGTSPSQLANLGTVTQTFWTDQSLKPGATYYYAVTAEDSGMDYSPKSAIATVVMYNDPSPPTGLAFTMTSNIPPGAPEATYMVTLTWNPATGGGLPINFYELFRGTSPTSLTQIATLYQDPYIETDIVGATTYYYSLVAVDTAGDSSTQSSLLEVRTGGGVSGSFNILPMTITSFTPTTANLPGLPTVETSAGPVASVGYQEGKVANEKTVYFPWQVSNGGTSWLSDISDGIPQSVILSYDATQGINGFANAGAWTYFDLSTLSWYSKGTVQPGNTDNGIGYPNLPAGFQGGAVAGNMVYPAPKAGGPGPNGGGGPYPVFVQYDSSKALNDPSAYQTFVPPPETSNVMGYTYGWCNAVFDGQFIYYAPLSNAVTGNSGNIFRYDTTQPFSNLASGGPTPAWANFDVLQTPVYNTGGLDPNAQGFQAVVYDGNRYIYFIPFNANLIVRYDTWDAGVAPNPAGFTKVSNYITFDPTQLGTTGYPPIAGLGSASNLQGFTGATVVWDVNNQNEYLYLVPWATFPGSAQNPVSQTTAARVRIGTMSAGVWHPVDIAATTGTPPNWQMYDLSLLTQNPAWPTEWPIFQYNPQLPSISSLAGYQSAFVTTGNSSGATFPPRVGYVPDTSLFLVEHDVGHNLYDPTGWYLSEIPLSYSFGTMGGGYDAKNSILYPASPNVPYYAFQF